MEYGLIGERLGHSFSREIHAKIADYDYELCEISKENLADFFEKRDFRAVNVTIPYKGTVMPFLDEISDSALKIGAVNTVVNCGGRLLGYNTDYMGASAMIAHSDINVKGRKVLILGTGGTSKTLHAVVSDMDAAQVVTVSRKKQSGAITYEEVSSAHSDAQIIINTTPVGMYPNNASCPIDIGDFPSLEGVLDVIYNPLETRLVRDAKKRGLKASGGLYMLAAQAVYASALFTGTLADASAVDKTYRAVMSEKRNIVLIGMPSCGKSSVGMKLAERMGRKFYDSDTEIVRREAREISEIFKNDGESAFRQIEREVIDELSRQNGAVIATGGGAVLDSDNAAKLSQNGILLFLDRPLEMLIATDDRPLSSNADALKKRYEERYPIYTSVADRIIDGGGSVDDAVNSIIEVMNDENTCD